MKKESKNLKSITEKTSNEQSQDYKFMYKYTQTHNLQHNITEENYYECLMDYLEIQKYIFKEITKDKPCAIAIELKATIGIVRKEPLKDPDSNSSK